MDPFGSAEAQVGDVRMVDRRTVRGRSPAADAEARDRLVEAARIAFGTNGFHGTTTRDIAAAAGMSPAAVYVHHPSKEALLFALSREGHLATLAGVEAAAAGAGDPVEQVRAVAGAFVGWVARHHTSARIVNYELAALTDEHRAEIDALRRQIQDVLREAIEAGRVAGVFECPDPSMTAMAIMGMAIDVARWFRDAGRWSPEDVAEHHAQMALRMVGVRDQRGGRS